MNGARKFYPTLIWWWDVLDAPTKQAWLERLLAITLGVIVDREAK